MMLRPIHLVFAAISFALPLSLVAVVWDGPSGFVRAAAEWVAMETAVDSLADEPTYSWVGSGTCSDDAVLFAECEAPVAQPFQGAIPVRFQVTGIIPQGTLAKGHSAADGGLSSGSCAAKTCLQNGDAESGRALTPGSCCQHAENAAGSGGAAPGASSCSCDPQECKCI